MECTCVTAPGEPDPPPGLEVKGLAATSVQLKWKVCTVCMTSILVHYLRVPQLGRAVER